MKRGYYVLATLMLLALPSVAMANAGTPLMWAGFFHLMFGNLIIGVLEGLLLAKLFGLPKWKCVGLLILANYVSAWLGGRFLSRAVAGALRPDLSNVWLLFWVMVVITYVLTLLIEYPFVAFAFRGDRQWKRKSIRGSLIIQSVSYLILFAWYWMASSTSLCTDTELVAISSMSLPEDVLVYFISADDGDVYGGSLRPAGWRKVFDLNAKGRYDHLLIEPSKTDVHSWDLVACLAGDGDGSPAFTTVKEQLALAAVPSSVYDDARLPRYARRRASFGGVPKLGEAESSSWKFTVDYWPCWGLWGIEETSGKKVSFALETPFVSWAVRYATHLPTDKVVFQLGADQICIYDPAKRQVALLARGQGPIAVIDKGQADEAQ